eukprot:CAMPEP_0179001138 /NCGR_PEP_ID=MMETSP0795-20121207/11146_1 /TAXON_ID=88552 /ORGANISM="Amoebophrya sp., Strain Ameob2" /LENGTH=90 /DNA_ID=CAMNT_0020694383 /DNA_START=51 /DNA_END=323 /DNA_ORIENTATION=+
MLSFFTTRGSNLWSFFKGKTGLDGSKKGNEGNQDGTRTPAEGEQKEVEESKAAAADLLDQEIANDVGKDANGAAALALKEMEMVREQPNK